jgi:hypothetical protein
MTVGVTALAAAPALNAWAALINAAGGLQRLEVYTNARPATGAAAGAEPAVRAGLLAGSAVVADAELSLSAPGTSVLALADGPPVWARLYGGDGSILFDFDARLSTDPDDGEEVVVVAPSLDVGAVVRVSLGSITLPG